MGKSVARGTILGITGQAWHLVTALVLYAFLARRLGPADFGRWKLTLSVLTWFELFVNSGLVKVAVKRIAESPEDRPTLTRGAYLGQSFLAAVLFAAALIGAGPIAATLGDPTLAFLLRVSALDIPLYAAFMVAASVLLGVRRFERQALGMAVYSAAKLASIGVLVYVGFSVPGALVGNALSSLVGFAVTFWSWKGEPVGWRATTDTAAEMGRAAGPFLAQNLVEGLGTGADLWFVQGVLRNAVSVGLYGSASALAEIPAFLFIGLNRALFPSVAAAARSDARLAARFAQQGVRLALLVAVLGAAAIAATAPQVLRLIYSAPYAGAAVPLSILMLAAAGRTTRSVCTEVLMATDRRRRALTILVAGVALELVLLAVLTHRFGTTGTAAAIAIAMGAAGSAAAISLRRALGLRVLLTLARSVLAAVAVGAVLFLLHLPPIGLVVAYPCAALAYVALLWLLREFDADDIASVRTAIGR
ncbi:MAG TPA: oligosaccharide flippase family protein [Coriobacteriia bacterium]